MFGDESSCLPVRGISVADGDDSLVDLAGVTGVTSQMDAADVGGGNAATALTAVNCCCLCQYCCQMSMRSKSACDDVAAVVVMPAVCD